MADLVTNSRDTGIKILSNRVNRDVDDATEDVYNIVSAVKPNWTRDDTKIESLVGGGLNHLFCFHLKDDKERHNALVVRVFREDKNSSAEELAMKIAESTGCGKPLYASFKNGFVYGYARGQLITWNDLWDHQTAKLVMQCLARLHSVDIAKFKGSDGNPLTPSSKPCLFQRMWKFVKKIPSSLSNPQRNIKLQKEVPSYEILSSELTKLESFITRLNLPIIFCHNDVWVNNMVFSSEEDRVYMIDYEFSDFNYDGFDIASFFGCFPIVAEVENSGLYDGMNPHDFTPRSKLDYPNEMLQSWVKEYLIYRYELIGKDPSTLTEHNVKYFHAKVKILAIASGLYWSLLTLSICDYEQDNMDLLDFGLIRLKDYYKNKDEMYNMSLPKQGEFSIL